MSRIGLILLVGAFGSTACIGEGVIYEPAGDGGSLADAPQFFADGGLPRADGGLTSPDGGLWSADAAPLAPDAAPPPPDAAPLPPDAMPPGSGISPVVITGDPNDPVAVCANWNAQGSTSLSWSGDIATCDAGDITVADRTNIVYRVNLHRWMAGLPAVGTTGARDQGAQECSLMMDANNALSHSPPPEWTCWNSSGASTAGASNIATVGGKSAILLYMVDPGNSSTLGHRRWILNNSLGPIGVGSTSSSGSSCLRVIGGSGSGGRAWTAYPPPGPFPIQANSYGSSVSANINNTGWSIQSDSMSLGGAVVVVTRQSDNAVMPVIVSSLLANYGSGSAIKVLPDGWTAAVGATYHVDVTSVSSPFSYDVSFIDCP